VSSVAASNGNFIAGVTSQTTLMAIKALGIVPCHWSSTIRGIYYAADHGADVLNISSGAYIRRHLSARYFRYYLRAVQYALGRGVSAIVVAAGNSAVDLDRDIDLTALYCDVPEVICVAATGPTDSGPHFLGPWSNIDSPAFYTNFGSSAITVAAPGGNVSFDTSGNVTGISYVTGACATTDRMFDANGDLVRGVCSSGPYYFAGNIGTSFAAPHVSGLAALLVSKFGHGQSAQIKAAIENSADDLGKPGVDPFYGRGRINVARALAVP
jgi:subtilisin family serine protease